MRACVRACHGVYVCVCVCVCVLFVCMYALVYVCMCAYISCIVAAMSSFAELVVVEQLGKVMTIGINRPEVRNCVNPATATQLVAAFDRFEETEEALVAVLYGKGQSVT